MDYVINCCLLILGTDLNLTGSDSLKAFSYGDTEHGYAYFHVKCFIKPNTCVFNILHVKSELVRKGFNNSEKAKWKHAKTIRKKS